MKTLLANKSLIRTLAVVLAVLLVVALIPQIPTALSDPEAHLEDATLTEMADTGEEGEEEGEGDEQEESSEESDGDEEFDEEALAAWMAENGGFMLMNEPDENEEEEEDTPGDLPDSNTDGEIPAHKIAEGNLSYTGGGAYQLTVNGTLNGTIYVDNGSKLTILGTGLINGNGAATVIHVNGQGSHLTLGNADGTGPTVTGGNGGTLLNVEDRDAKNPRVAGKTNTASWGEYFSNASGDGSDRYYAGGGILIQRNVTKSGNTYTPNSASFLFRGGTVSGNSARAGGGIFVDRDCAFTMTNGTVSGNTATIYEGGGIYTASKRTCDEEGNTTLGNCYIAAGTIEKNITATTFAWGGGGIFVENEGVLLLENSLVYDNSAKGMGGGISGCPHARVGIGGAMMAVSDSTAEITEALLMYGNTADSDGDGNPANGAGWPSNIWLHRLPATYKYNDTTIQYRAGDVWAKNDSDFTPAKANDYYVTNISYINSFAGPEMAGKNAWTGYVKGDTGANISYEDGNYPREKATSSKNTDLMKDFKASVAGRDLTLVGGSVKDDGSDDGSYTYVGASVGLTSTRSGDGTEERSVKILSNSSSTHGGGIGCNGVVKFGEITDEEEYSPLSIDMEKLFRDSDGDPVALVDGQFAFNLKIKNTDTVVASAKNDRNGAVVFKMDKDAVEDMIANSGIGGGQSGTINLTLTEQKSIADERIISLLGGKDSIDVALNVRHDVKSTDALGVRVATHELVLQSMVVDGHTYTSAQLASGTLPQLVNTLSYNERRTYAGTYDLVVDKSYVNSFEQEVPLPADAFAFELVDPQNPDEVIATANNNAEGKIQFEDVDLSQYLKAADAPVAEWSNAQNPKTVTVDFLLREVDPQNHNVVCDKNTYTVRLTVGGSVGEPVKDQAAGTKTYTVTADVDESKTQTSTNNGAFSAGTPTFKNTLKLTPDESFGGFGLTFGKDFYTTLGLTDEQKLNVANGEFSFTLSDANGKGNVEVKSENDANGKVSFVVDETTVSQDYLASLFSQNNADITFEPATPTADANGTFVHTATVTRTFNLKENKPEAVEEVDGEEVIVYDEKTHEVEVEFALTRTHTPGRTHTANDATAYDNIYTTAVARVVKVDGDEVDGTFNIVNRYKPHGFWQLTLGKNYYGGAAGTFDFTMVEVSAPMALATEELPLVPSEAADPDSTYPDLLVNPILELVSEKEWKATYNSKGYADITFDAVAYIATGIDEGNRNDIGEHWYLVSEDGAFVDNKAVAGMDSTVYLIQVDVSQNVQNAEGKKKLDTQVKNVWYADDPASGMWHKVALPETSSSTASTNFTTTTNLASAVAFHNTDNTMAFALASYSVYAASGEAVDQVCYVDPKLIKNLEGRSIKTDEFSFELREVPQDAVDDFYKYNSEGKLVLNTDGPVISATSNDEFGMVDFDKANNQAGEGFEPSCLKYTQPGTYHYVVVETDGMKDASVVYNPAGDVITFTTEIVLDEATGKLECVNMYYGHLDSATGKNVPYADQYTEGNTAEPGSRAAFANLNMDWHPTITNVVKPMDLQVRKTSVSDRTEGLEGATYGLYMVNDNKEGDILLASETSDENGWITFRDVSLTENTLYYFKEIAAPAGHTVSEFRSSYFKVVETKDEAGTTYYKLEYQDSKYAGTEAGTVDDEPLATPMALALDEEGAEGAGAEAAEGEPVEAAENAEAAEPAEAGSNLTASAAADGVTYDKDTGNLLLTYALDGGVYDEVTDVSFNKLDTRTHEWVSGAKLAIIEKDSGTEMVSWVSGEESKQVQKTLNVGTTYILRELEAPANYRKAGDVEFVIDNYGKVEILSGTDNGNAELSDSTITLYDTMLDAEEVETQERTNIIQRLAQTGDPMLLGGLGVVAVAALALMVLAAYCRRKTHEE